MPPPLPSVSRALSFFPPPTSDSSTHPAADPKSAALSGKSTAWELESQRTRGRLRKGTRAEDAFPLQDPFQAPASFSSFEDSGFQTQEYLAALIQGDPRDVERIAALPLERVEPGAEGAGEGPDNEEELVTLVSPDCWVFEHMRRLCLDLTLWVVYLQKECSRETCPDMRAADWLYICATHATETEGGCCAIDYIQHTLDGATALLCSPRYFPSRLNIPDTSLKHFTAISRRLYRIFAHAYFHHREIFEDCEADTSLYSRFLALTAFFDLVDADVGTPPVNYLALLDTGSADLVIETAVQADSCNGCQTDGPLYSPAASSSADVTTTPVELIYGIGNDTGVLVSDVVTFGGYTLPKTTMAACDINSLFGNIGATTALLGLGWKDLAATNSTPFVQQLWQNGLLANPVFGMGLAESGSNAAGDKLVSGGYLTIGDTNRSLYTGELTWTPLADPATGYWDVPLQNTLVNGRNLGLSTTAAVIDSGTNGIVVPTSAYTLIWQAVPGAELDAESGHYTYPCSTNVTLAFVFSGQVFTMAPETFERSVVSMDGKSCSGTVRDGGSADQPWIIGSPFFESVYLAFRYEPAAVGFAPLANPGSVLDNSAIPSVKTSLIAATGTAPGSRPTSMSTSTGTLDFAFTREGLLLLVTAAIFASAF